MTTETIIALASLLVTIAISLVGAFSWVRQKRKTALAEILLKASETAREEAIEEKDRSRLKLDQQQLLQSMYLISEKVREIKQETSEIKTLLLARKKED